ncbi:MAG: hypothetical protein IPH54_23545 [Rhodoferax sp.]|jgi:hypothetical protein|nr:hypothetical protein [Rhodoferax sp.]
MTSRDKLIYALMFIEIGDDISLCDAHHLIQSELYDSDVDKDVLLRISKRATNAIISGVFTNAPE